MTTRRTVALLSWLLLPLPPPPLLLLLLASARLLIHPLASHVDGGVGGIGICGGGRPRRRTAKEGDVGDDPPSLGTALPNVARGGETRTGLGVAGGFASGATTAFAAAAPSSQATTAAAPARGDERRFFALRPTRSRLPRLRTGPGRSGEVATKATSVGTGPLRPPRTVTKRICGSVFSGSMATAAPAGLEQPSRSEPPME